MTQKEMLDFIQKNVQKQGNEGALNIAPLLVSMVNKMFADPSTGVSPIVVTIGEQGEETGTKTQYELTTEQETINQYIADFSEEKASARLFVQDGDVLIGFSYVESDEDMITATALAPDGTYKLYLSTEPGKSYFEHDDEVKSIASVTEAEIEAYNSLFKAQYNPVNNKFDVVIGTVHAQLTPGQMMLTNEEYNKSSNDGNFTAMWANSIANYLCCPAWFHGFAGFNLHSAFYNAKKTIFIDLNTVELNVTNLTNTFKGCERLEQITGILKVAQNVPLTDAFKGCSVLHSVKISGLASTIDLSDCPQLSVETIEFLITQSTQPTSGTFNLIVSSTTKNNINNNSAWQSVRDALAEKTYIEITTPDE